MPTGIYIRTEKNKHSLKTKAKMSKSHLGNTNGFKKGGISFMKGKKHSEKSILKISLANKGKNYSPKTQFLKGRIPPNKGIKQPCISFAHYPELRFAIDNGRTLCIDCHKTTYLGILKSKTVTNQDNP